MKFLVFSDLHIHNYKKFDNNGSRLKNCLSVLVDVFSYAHDRDIEYILFPGDLYDQQKALSVPVVTKTLQVFTSLFDAFPKIKFIAISGNHDHSSKNTLDRSAITSLTHLSELFENFILLDNKSMEVVANNKTVTVYGIPYYSHKEHFIEKVPKLHPNNDGINLLMIHQTPKHSNEMIPHECTVDDFQDFDFVFCGHIHKHESLSENFVIVGSPLHRDLGDEGQDKGFLIYDTLTNTYDRVLLDYPKFKRSKVLVEDSDDYVIPIVDDVEDDSMEVISLNDSYDDMLRKYLEAVGKIDYLDTGLSLL